MDIRLSKSQLDKFQDCPRCFWLGQRHKLRQPDMISSKVWKGVERVTVAHYETHRKAKTTPENLIGQVPAGAIPVQLDELAMKALRYWGKGLAFKVGDVLVTTALDDMLQIPDGSQPKGSRYAVIDYKSKAKLTDEESTAQMYQNQADVFDLACNVNDYPTDGTVYFDYWSPASVEGAEPPANAGDTGFTMQRWASQVIAIKADHARIKKLVLAAAACIESKMPEPKLERSIVTRGANKGAEKVDGCAVCVYLLEREELFTALAVA
jgi:hypothetical protein